jgi:hypothetical protein
MSVPDGVPSELNAVANVFEIASRVQGAVEQRTVREDF